MSTTAAGPIRVTQPSFWSAHASTSMSPTFTPQSPPSTAPSSPPPSWQQLHPAPSRLPYTRRPSSANPDLALRRTERIIPDEPNPHAMPPRQRNSFTKGYRDWDSLAWAPAAEAEGTSALMAPCRL